MDSSWHQVPVWQKYFVAMETPVIWVPMGVLITNPTPHTDIEGGIS